MAVPIIDDIEVNPDPVPHGQSATIRVFAHDSDAQVVNISLTVTDTQGNVTQGSDSFLTSDPLTYSATVDVGFLTQDSLDPSVFVWSPGEPAPHSHG